MKLNLNLSNRSISIDQYKNKKINLMPPELKERKRILFYRIVFIAAAGLLATSSVFQYMNTRDAIGRVEGSIQQEQMLIASLKSEDTYINVLNSHFTRIEGKDHVLNMLDDRNQSILLVLRLVESSTPKEIKYLNLNFNSENQVAISGISDSETAIADFQYNLKKATVEKNKFYNDVFVNNISKIDKVRTYGAAFSELAEESPYEYQFRIVCQFGGDVVENQ